MVLPIWHRSCTLEFWRILTDFVMQDAYQHYKPFGTNALDHVAHFLHTQNCFTWNRDFVEFCRILLCKTRTSPTIPLVPMVLPIWHRSCTLEFCRILTDFVMQDAYQRYKPLVHNDLNHLAQNLHYRILSNNVEFCYARCTPNPANLYVPTLRRFGTYLASKLWYESCKKILSLQDLCQTLQTLWYQWIVLLGTNLADKIWQIQEIENNSHFHKPLFFSLKINAENHWYARKESGFVKFTFYYIHARDLLKYGRKYSEYYVYLRHGFSMIW